MPSYDHNRVSIDRLREVLEYCSVTGQFTWKVSPAPRIKAGALAGKVNPRGYAFVTFERTTHAAHRLAWAFHYGEWPESGIDHINRIKTDNRIANLRLATASQNNANYGIGRANTSGFKGVTRLRHGSWQAQIQVNGKNHYLGAFRSKEDAAGAYSAAAQQFFGEFAGAGGPP
ncbi:HNH endonuclease [Massilia timonae]|uniref:HNH endonuclease n=1 Tax=Massilia timonae TaxID=47229 RepID=UPI00289906C6|nr:HNH endonuclease [Massilia timonae]